MSIKRIDVIKEQLKNKDIKGISNIKDSGKGLVVNYGSGVSTYYRWANFTDDKIINDIIANSKGLGKPFTPQRAKMELSEALSAKGYSGYFGHFEDIARDFLIVKRSTGEQIKYKINFDLIKRNFHEYPKYDVVFKTEYNYDLSRPCGGYASFGASF